MIKISNILLMDDTKIVDRVEDAVEEVDKIASEPNIRRIPEIDFFKGIAVLSMVIFHVFYMGNMMNKADFPIDRGLLRILARTAQLIFITCIHLVIASFNFPVCSLILTNFRRTSQISDLSSIAF